MFDPYHKWLGIPKDQRPPTHYQLLGIAPGESDAEVIEEAAVRQTAHVRTYQIGPHAADCTRVLNEISQAKLTLLTPAKRKAYDEQLATTKSTQVTAKAPAAIAPAPAPAFHFEDAARPVATLPKKPPRSPARIDISKPQSRAVLWLGLGAGGVALLLVATIIAVMVGHRREPAPPPPIAKKAEQPPQNPILRVPEDPEPDKGKLQPIRPQENPPPIPPPPVQPVDPPFVPVVQGIKPQRLPGSGSFRIKENRIEHLALSPDGGKIAAGFLQAHVYDVRGGHCRRSWRRSERAASSTRRWRFIRTISDFCMPSAPSSSRCWATSPRVSSGHAWNRRSSMLFHWRCRPTASAP